MKYSAESSLWRPVARVTFRFATQNNRKKEIAMFVWPRLLSLGGTLRYIRGIRDRRGTAKRLSQAAHLSEPLLRLNNS